MTEATETTTETTETTETTSEAKPWTDSLSEGVRTPETLEVLKNYKTQDDLVTDFMKVRGELPKTPETAEGYEFKDLPEGVEFKDEDTVKFRDFCFKHKVPNETASDLLKMHLEDIPKITEAALQAFNETIDKENKEAREKCENALKDEWKGEAFKENKNIANTAFHKLCEHVKVDPKSFGEFGNDPNVIKIFHAIGTKMSEDSWDSGKATPQGEKSAAQTLYPDMK